MDYKKYKTLVNFAMDDIEKYLELKNLLIEQEKVTEQEATKIIKELISNID